MPEPCAGERPTVYADRVGEWYSASVSPANRKHFGQYLTPVAVADFMAGLLAPGRKTLRIADPGAGTGTLACAACEHLSTGATRPTHLVVAAYEMDEGLQVPLNKTLSYLAEYLHKRNIHLEFAVSREDFILKYAHTLQKPPTFFDTYDGGAAFDICISNPPYFKLPKSDPRARAAAEVVHGQPNIYALFMAVGASILSQGGQFVFITPRSFASGPYFRLFRQRFFETMRPEFIHIFDSRRDAFRRDNVLQENIIIKARREDNWHCKAATQLAVISSSTGADDVRQSKGRKVPLSSVLDVSSKEKVLKVGHNSEVEQVVEKMDSWTGSLHKYGLEISTGPVVAFRALQFILEKPDARIVSVPLLWLQNVRRMRVVWPTGVRRKPQYIEASDRSQRLLVPAGNYVLLRRFSAKEEPCRLTAAPFIAREGSSEWLGLENHLNYIHRVGGVMREDEAWGLAVLYNSSFFDAYFRTLNGSTQVGATEVRSIPLPPLEIIREIGNRAMACASVPDHIDALAYLAFDGKHIENRKVADAK